jgi:short-subunit dehydrogenase
MFTFKGRTALVTGASKGLGAAFARALAQRGANLVLVARSTGALETLADQLSSEFGISCVALSADLGAPEAAARIAQELDRRGLTIDLLVNNAGLGLSGRFLSHDITAEQASVRVNVQSLIGLSHILGSKMVERGGGGIINVASNAAFQSLPLMAVYAATKAFVLSFSEALRHELSALGVQVMASCPGPTATNFFETTTTTMRPAKFDTADIVATRSLQAFEKGKAVAYPGRFSVRAATWVPRFLPRGLMVRLAGSNTKAMGLAA